MRFLRQELKGKKNENTSKETINKQDDCFAVYSLGQIKLEQQTSNAAKINDETREGRSAPYVTLNTYRKSSIKPPGGLIYFKPI